MSDVMISAKGLSKRYRLGELGSADSLRDAINKLVHRFAGYRPAEHPPLWALKDISFDVGQGEVVGIIGRNGAGKSTLLKILSRITLPTEGQVVVRGRVSSLLEVGTGFHPDLTGRENIFLNGTILGMSRSEVRSKFDQIVAFAEIEDFLDTPVKRFSSGMYVRLAFAVAAHLEPEILIVDEVLAVGDMKFQQKCLGRMKDVAGQGRTVLFVSHNMTAVSVLCGRGILLDKGSVVIDGTVGEAVTTYVLQMVEHGGAIEWKERDMAPGNDIVRLRSVGVYQEGAATPSEKVFISKPIVIRIDYECLRDGAQLYTALWLRDRMNVDVLATFSGHGATVRKDEWYGRPHGRGRYVSECTIPGDFLNEGSYSVTPILGQVPSQTIVLLENALSFTVVEDGSMREEYTGQWIGCVRPRLLWQTRALS